jgi:hypothetical protein
VLGSSGLSLSLFLSLSLSLSQLCQWKSTERKAGVMILKLRLFFIIGKITIDHFFTKLIRETSLWINWFMSDWMLLGCLGPQIGTLLFVMGKNDQITR